MRASYEPTDKELQDLGIHRSTWGLWAIRRHYNRHSRQNPINNCIDEWCKRATKYMESGEQKSK